MGSDGGWDAIVLGAGMAGLACAAYLGRSGKRVIVVEQHSRPGGLWTSFSRRGIVFDISTHWIIDPDAINAMLRELGRPPVDFARLQHLGRYVGPPGCWDLLVGADIEGFKRIVRGSFPSVEEGAVDRLVRKALDMDRLLVSLPVYSPESASLASRLQARLRTLVHLPKLLRYGRMPAEKLLESLFPGEAMAGLRAGLFTIAPIPGMPAIGTLAMLGIALRGRAHKPQGGSQVLADAFAFAATANGAEIRYSRKVTGITTTSVPGSRRGRLTHRVTGVTLDDGTSLRAPVVVSTVDARQTFFQLLDPELTPASFRDTLASQPLSESYALVSVVTDLDLAELGFDDTDVFVCPSADVPRVLESKEPEECAFLLAFPQYSVAGADPALHGVQIVAPAAFGWRDHWRTGPHLERGAAYRALKGEWAAKLVERVEEHIPGLASHLVHVDVATPITLHRYTLNSEGAPVGWHYKSQRRWRQRVSFVAGLYLAGHWVGPSGALPATRSGRWAAEMVLADSRR